MKNKTKLLSLLLTLGVLFALSACGGGGGSTDPALEGKYIPVVGEMYSIALTGEEMEGFAIELKSGGKGVFTIYGEDYNVKWKSDETTVTVTADGEDMVAEQGEDCLVFNDVLGSGMKLTFAKEGSAAADPALYLPEGDKAMLGDWQSTEAMDILHKPVDASQMAPDALTMTFYGDHTADFNIAGQEFTGISWSNMTTMGTVDSDDLKLSWKNVDGGLEVTYITDDDSYIFFCPDRSAA